MATTKKEKAKAELENALYVCMDKREEFEENFEALTTGFGAAVVKAALDEMSERWGIVVTAQISFADSRQARDEAEALELENYVTKYKEEHLKTSSLKQMLRQALYCLCLMKSRQQQSRIDTMLGGKLAVVAPVLSDSPQPTPSPSSLPCNAALGEVCCGSSAVIQPTAYPSPCFSPCQAAIGEDEVSHEGRS